MSYGLPIFHNCAQAPFTRIICQYGYLTRTLLLASPTTGEFTEQFVPPSTKLKSNSATSTLTTSALASVPAITTPAPVPAVSTPTPSSTPTYTPSPTPVGAIVGGVVGGLAVIALVAITIVLVLRRRSQNQAFNAPPAVLPTQVPRNTSQREIDISAVPHQSQYMSQQPSTLDIPVEMSAYAIPRPGTVEIGTDRA
jgi:hypothetical protein